MQDRSYTSKSRGIRTCTLKWCPSPSHPCIQQDFPVLHFFLNPLNHFAVSEEVTTLQKVMLKGKPVRELDDSNRDRSWWRTVHLRTRSLLTQLKQFFLTPPVFSLGVFIQEWRYQISWPNCKQSAHGFPFLLWGPYRGWDVPKEKMTKFKAQLWHFQAIPNSAIVWWSLMLAEQQEASQETAQD